MSNMNKAAALAHGTSSTETPIGRARVRTDDDGLTAITTMQRGAYQTIFYTRDEVDALINALQRARIHTRTTLAVDWGKDRDAQG